MSDCSTNRFKICLQGTVKQLVKKLEFSSICLELKVYIVLIPITNINNSVLLKTRILFFI